MLKEGMNRIHSQRRRKGKVTLDEEAMKGQKRELLIYL